MWYNSIMKKVSLTNGGFALVDDQDYEFVTKWNWQNMLGYAVRSVYVKNHNYGKGKNRSINKLVRMHRVINQTPVGFDTDHINGDKLDNRRSNLRNATRSQNAINRICKGVQFRNDRKRSPYRVYISHDKKEIYIGCFRTFEEAEQVYYTVDKQLNEGIRQW